MSDLAIEYDPYSHELHAEPYGVYRALRDHAPVYRNPEHGYYALTRHADVFAALHDWHTLSSADGITLEGLPPDIQPEMITMDPPRHDELRDIVKPAFAPKRIAVLQERVHHTASKLVDALDPDDLDLVRDLAVPLPAIVIAELLGIPAEDQLAFRGWADALIRRDVRVPATLERARDASIALSSYLADTIVDRRKHPTEDLIGMLVQAHGDAARLSDLELLGFSRLLLVAGNETTAHLIGNGLLALARHPQQQAAVVADPELLPAVVEETLRYDAPVQTLARTLMTDYGLHGVVMTAGAKVVLVLGSANRDEREFDDPDRFDIHRPLRSIVRAVAFGHGIHHCIGAALARIEAREAIAQVLLRFPTYAVTTADIDIVHSGVVRGPASLPARAVA